jgi:regulator of protease activity HflC (stomatin/prohibitin superfamily)
VLGRDPLREVCQNFVIFSQLIVPVCREQIAHWMETTLDDAADPWGVKVERVEM